MPNVDVRLASTTDTRALADCMVAAYAQYEDQIEDLPDVTEGLSSAVLGKSVWVAEHLGQLVGGIVVKLKPDYLLIENIAVHPDHKGHGIGKALIQLAISECERLKLSEIKLSTHREMTNNIALYEHFGWQVTSTTGNKVHMSRQFTY